MAVLVDTVDLNNKVLGHFIRDVPNRTCGLVPLRSPFLELALFVSSSESESSDELSFFLGAGLAGV